MIPVPGSDAVDATTLKTCTTYRLAEEIAKRLPIGRVEPSLHFDQLMTSAHSASGSRDPALILPRLVVTKPSPAGAYILVDDVYTSGGHMRACEAKLRENGISVWAAIAAARTNDVEEQYPFSLVSVEVEGYEP